MFKLFIKKRDILYRAYREKDLHLGARLELWLLSEDSRGDKYIACDMADLISKVLPYMSTSSSNT